MPARIAPKNGCGQDIHESEAFQKEATLVDGAGKNSTDHHHFMRNGIVFFGSGTQLACHCHRASERYLPRAVGVVHSVEFRCGKQTARDEDRLDLLDTFGETQRP